MFDSNLLRGILFNQIQGLLLRAMNAVESESDLLVKIARIIKNDPNITHDHHFFRKVRAKTITGEEIKEYLSAPLPYDYPKIENYDIKAFGGWLIFKGTLSALSQHLLNDDPLKNYFRYLDAHCDLEYQFMLQLKSTENKSLVQTYIQDWLLIEGVDFVIRDKMKMLSYAIRMIMYWAANLELYLELEFECDDHSILPFVLPSTLVKKDAHYFSPSSEKLLFRLNAMWAKKTYQKTKISNEKLFRDILVRQFEDPDIDTSNHDRISPNTTAIKKRFHRWSSGDLFTLTFFRQNIAILTRPFADSKNDITVLLPYILVNLFTLTQKELMKEGFNPEIIVSEFSNYPTYKILVKKRYDEFVASGNLTP